MGVILEVAGADGGVRRVQRLTAPHTLAGRYGDSNAIADGAAARVERIRTRTLKRQSWCLVSESCCQSVDAT